MIEVRTERAADVAGIRALHVAAFDTPAEAGLVDALRDSDAWVPDLSVVGVDEARVVAHALLSRVVLSTADGDVPALVLGPVAVLPEVQRRGYGSAVVRDAVARRGDRLVVLLGAPAYYRRFGFRPAGQFGITGTYAGFGEAWQALPPSGGTPPGDVRFPPPWDGL